MVVKFKVILRQDPEAGGYIASCPALPGCASQGETEEEATESIREAIEGVLSALNEKAHPKSSEHLVEVEV